MYLALYILMLVETGISIVAGSLELTSSPATATDGELFTMMCTGSQGGERAWVRDDVNPVFRTQPENRELQLISPSLTGDLVGRVNVSGSDDGTQHNVTLKINSRIDNGDVWWCTDYVHSDTSNTLTITTAVTSSTTAVVTTSMQSTHTGGSASDPTAERRLSSSTGMFTITSSDTTPTTSSSSKPTYVIVAVAATAVVIIGIVVVILCVRKNRRIRSRKVTKRASVAPVVEVEVNRSSGNVESNEISDGEGEVTDLYATVNKPQKMNIVADNGDIYTIPNKSKK